MVRVWERRSAHTLRVFSILPFVGSSLSKRRHPPAAVAAVVGRRRAGREASADRVAMALAWSRRLAPLLATWGFEGRPGSVSGGVLV